MAIHHNIFAQGASASATAKATATIVAPIKISKTTDLSFGNIVAGSTAGTVKIETDNSRTTTGDVILPTETPGEPTAAQFQVEGQPYAAYSVSYPASLIVIRQGGSEIMLIDQITINPTTRALSKSGQQTLKIGATLHVDANQSVGIYENDNGIKVTVAYQ